MDHEASATSAPCTARAPPSGSVGVTSAKGDPLSSGGDTQPLVLKLRPVSVSRRMFALELSR
jgi:hypothetical protein